MIVVMIFMLKIGVKNEEEKLSKKSERDATSNNESYTPGEIFTFIYFFASRLVNWA